MDDEGDEAHGLEEQAAATVEAARELQYASAALAARRPADKEVLRCRAVALDTDVRRLHGSVAPIDPAAVEKVCIRPPLSPSPSYSSSSLSLPDSKLNPRRSLLAYPVPTPSLRPTLEADIRAIKFDYRPEARRHAAPVES
ncbi:hypothetical protein ZWY2020_049648 [Hordeum vulgare]|nr:hypothetical protein ZWY2020_049648 [Hordeum vulgare]